MSARGPDLAAEIRSLLQPPTDTEQIDFERHLKCEQSKATSRALTSALAESYRFGQHVDVLKTPANLLPPMF